MKHVPFILTILVVLALSACNNKEKEAAEAAAAKAEALYQKKTTFLKEVVNFNDHLETNIVANKGEDFMMYRIPNGSLLTVLVDGDTLSDMTVEGTYFVKKTPGKNAFFRGGDVILSWKPSPEGYGVEYHAWPGNVVSAKLAAAYGDDKLVRGGTYDDWLEIMSIAELKAEMETGMAIALKGTMPSYYIDVYAYKGGKKGELLSRHLLFADGLR